MGNQSNVPQARRYQEDPIICCGEQPRRDNIDQASPNVMNVDKNTYGRFSRANTNTDKNDDNYNFEETGSTYYKQNDVTIFRKPGNSLQYSAYRNQVNNQLDNDNANKDRKEGGALRPITQLQNQMKKPGYSSFKKSSYGAFNNNKNAHNTFSSYGSTVKDKELKQNVFQNKDLSNHKPTPVVDFVGQKQMKRQMKQQKAKPNSVFIGQGKYGGRSQQFQNNKRIIMFLQDNYVKEVGFKFYDTKDESSLMNNSTVRLAKKKHGQIQQKYLDENSNSNLRMNQTLSKLQQPIQLNLQVDARIILATCLLIVAVVIVSLGATIFYSDVNFFICLMIGIILYVLYILVCYIYNDILEYFSNVRSFDQFVEDYNRLRQTDGQLAYHIHSQTPRKTTKQCYLLSKQNKYTKIQFTQNQNRDLTVDELKNKNISFLMVRYKTKTSFMDPQSQLNTIDYFDHFLQDHKNNVQQGYGSKKQSSKQSNKQSKKSSIKQISKSRIKKSNEKQMDLKQKRFKDSLIKSDFGYQLPPIQGLSSKPSQVFNVCYMDNQDNGCTVVLFVIFTLLGLCLPFLLIFQAYAKRYRINILNRFKVGQGNVRKR